MPNAEILKEVQADSENSELRAFVFITISPSSKQDLDSINESLKQIPGVIKIENVQFGRYDLVVHLTGQTASELTQRMLSMHLLKSKQFISEVNFNLVIGDLVDTSSKQ